MKRIIAMFIITVITMTGLSQPVVTQTGQFEIGSVHARFIKAWGDDFIISKFTTETSPVFLYKEEILLVDKFGQIIWSKNFTPRELPSNNNIVITNSSLFCIFTLGDTIYKMNKQGIIFEQKFLNSTVVEIDILSNDKITVQEVNVSSSESRFFIYDENLNLLSTHISQAGATNSVRQFGEDYVVAGDRYGGGINTNISSYIVKYSISGTLIWNKQFPDILEMRLIASQNHLYYCGVDLSYPHSKLIYGEIDKNSGDIIWAKIWRASYPDTLPTLLRVRQMFASPDGGFTAVGVVTAPGQEISSYDQNKPAGFILGYSLNYTDPLIKLSDGLGRFYAGDWHDSSLIIIGHFEYPFPIPKVIIYSVSGLTAIDDNEISPGVFTLGQNYPNPFNPSTKIKFRVPETGFITLKVYDLLGREVAVLVNEELPGGEHEVPFDASSITSGVYIYTLSAGGLTESRKMVLMR